MSKNPFRYFKTSSEIIQLGVLMGIVKGNDIASV